MSNNSDNKFWTIPIFFELVLILLYFFTMNNVSVSFLRILSIGFFINLILVSISGLTKGKLYRVMPKWNYILILLSNVLMMFLITSRMRGL